MTATIRPLPGGKAELTVNGVDRICNGVWAALTEARAANATVEVLRFPPTPHDTQEVTA